jgi:hypothetical protein
MWSYFALERIAELQDATSDATVLRKKKLVAELIQTVHSHKSQVEQVLHMSEHRVIVNFYPGERTASPAMIPLFHVIQRQLSQILLDAYASLSANVRTEKSVYDAMEKIIAKGRMRTVLNIITASPTLVRNQIQNKRK